jgi:hypothetical protein
MSASVKVVVKGPIFDGQAAEAARALCIDIAETAAKQGQAIVRAKAKAMNKSGRGGKGIAAEHVTYRAAEMTATIIGTSQKGVTWWPWLEGTSKRNQSTRFGGYHTFRMATGIMRKRIKTLANKLMPEYLERMGGE